MSQSMREIVCDILTRDAAGETLEEMVSALEDIRSAALEEAARMLERRGMSAAEDGDKVAACVFEEAAAAIREMKEAEQPSGPSAEQVWERMTKTCGVLIGDECYLDESEDAPTVMCSFSSCPLLKEVQ